MFIFWSNTIGHINQLHVIVINASNAFLLLCLSKLQSSGGPCDSLRKNCDRYFKSSSESTIPNVRKRINQENSEETVDSLVSCLWWIFDFTIMNFYEEVRIWWNSMTLKGVTGYVWQLNWVCSIVDKFFQIHLRHLKRFKDL